MKMHMQKRMLSLILALVLLFSLALPAGAVEISSYSAAGTMTELAGGSKTAAGNYSISTAAELKALSSWVNAGHTGEGFTFYLTADIKLGGEAEPWTPIGQYDANNFTALYPFMGNFDGCGHEVTGLYIGGSDYTSGSGASNEANALFGVNRGTIKNLGVDGEVHTYRSGALVAGHNEGTIQYCRTSGSVGANGGGSTRGSGGIAGENKGTVDSCVSTATVHNDYRRAGGIVGYNHSKASVGNSYFAGSATSASAGYSGGIAATNDGTVTNCYWLEGSSGDSVGYYQEAAGATKTFTSDGKLSGEATTLLSALNSEAFKASAISGLPLLFWDNSDVSVYTVTIAQKDGGTISAVYGNAATPINGSAELAAGTVVKLTATAANSGYFFKSFAAGNTPVAGKAENDGSFTAQFTVSADVELSAVYTSYDEPALTVATQMGEYGKIESKKVYSYNELFTMAGNAQSTVGYMYTHGSDGWNVVGATQYVSVSSLLTDAGITPQNDDRIIALASDGNSSIIPTWEFLNQELYFYPNAYSVASGTNLSITDYPTVGKTAVPAIIALKHSTKKSGNQPATASDLLAAAASDAASAVFNGSLRFLYGSSEADYVNRANTSGSITGNRLWNGVETLVVRTKVDTDNVKINLFGTEHSLSELMAYETDTTFSCIKKGVTSEYDIKGITAEDLITKVAGLPADAYAGLTFTAGDGFTSSVKHTDYDWSKVMLIWDGNDASELNLKSAVNGGGGNLWNKGVVSVTGTDTAFNFNEKYLSIDQLKALAVTNEGWSYKGNNGAQTLNVTGATLASLLEAYAPDADPANIKFYERGNDGSRSYAKGSICLMDFPADQIMVIWDGKGSSEAELCSAANGGAGKQWWNKVVGCEIEETVLRIDGKPFSLNMIKDAQDLDGAEWSKGNGKATVTGATIPAILAEYPSLERENLLSLKFDDGNGFSPVYSVADSEALSKAAVIWREGSGDVFKSAVNGGAGNLWVRGLKNIYQLCRSSFTFTLSPATATLTVTDKDGAVISANDDGSYTLDEGSSYTYTVSAAGYTTKSDTFVPGKGLTSLSITLNAQGGSSGGGGGGGNEPPEDALFSFYVQNGENGTPVLKRSFVKSEINGVLQKGVFPYLFYKNGGWAAIVATEVLTLDSIFTESGISSEWKSGSYLKFTCNDGEYKKSYPDYDDINSAIYCFDSDGEATIVPAGIAISWESLTVGNEGAKSELTQANFNAIAEKAKDSGSYRLVYGTTEALFNSANAGGDAPAGARSPTGVISMTLVYNASSVPTGTVGTTHTPEENNNNETANTDTPAVTETLKPEAKADANGTATATVEAKAVSDAVTNAKANNADSIVIAPEVTGDAKEVKVELPKAAVSEVANGTNAALVVETDKGALELPNDTLAEITEQAGGANVEIAIAEKSVEDAGVKEAIAEKIGDADTANAAVAEITVSSGDEKITSFGGKSINASVSVDGKKNFTAGKKYLTLVISSNGKRELLAGKCSRGADGKLSVGVKVKHLSTFVVLDTELKSFADADAHWSADAVDFAVANGLMNGTSDAAFAPNSTLNRAMLVTILYRLAGKPAVAEAAKFVDVAAGEWYTDAVAWAAANGIVTGKTETTFAPMENITREQFATMLMRYCKFAGIDTASSANLGAFTDSAAISAYAKDALAWANASGIITGRTATIIAPTGSATRGEAATMLMRFMQL
jgi:hypothetical protein